MYSQASNAKLCFRALMVTCKKYKIGKGDTPNDASYYKLQKLSFRNFKFIVLENGSNPKIYFKSR